MRWRALYLVQSRNLRLWTLALLVVAGISAALYWGKSFGNSADDFAGVMGSLRAHANGQPMWMLVAMFSLALFIAFPLGVLTVLAGGLFGPWFGLFYLLSGAILSGTMSFIVGRYLGKDAISFQARESIAHLLSRFKSRGLLTVIVVRLIPIAPFAVANMALGAAGIRYHQFILGTALGMLPGAVAILWLADWFAQSST